MKKFFKKELKKPFAIIAFATLCFVITSKLLEPVPLTIHSLQTNQNNLFQVTGTGKVTEVPNSAQLMFSVSKTAPSVADAQNQTNTTIDAILASMKAAKISGKDITTINYTVFPQYNFDNGKQTPTGYTVTQDMQIKVSPIDKTSKILDILTANGANQIGGISFTFDDTTKKQLEEKAREQAVKNAQQKAHTLATAAAIHLGKIVNIQEETPTVSQVPFTATAVNSDKEQTITQLPPGNNSVTLSVTVFYETN